MYLFQRKSVRART